MDLDLECLVFCFFFPLALRLYSFICMPKGLQPLLVPGEKKGRNGSGGFWINGTKFKVTRQKEWKKLILIHRNKGNQKDKVI